MKKLSLPEFRDYCDTLSFRTIILSTVNQSWHSVDSTYSASLEFNQIIISFNPNIIYLRDKRNSLQLNKVKTIKLSEDKCLLGKVFTVVCGDLQSKFNDVEYTLIAQ